MKIGRPTMYHVGDIVIFLTFRQKPIASYRIDKIIGFQEKLYLVPLDVFGDNISYITKPAWIKNKYGYMESHTVMSPLEYNQFKAELL